MNRYMVGFAPAVSPDVATAFQARIAAAQGSWMPGRYGANPSDLPPRPGPPYNSAAGADNSAYYAQQEAMRAWQVRENQRIYNENLVQSPTSTTVDLTASSSAATPSPMSTGTKIAIGVAVGAVALYLYKRFTK